jgi:hypothetical protein
MADLARRVPLRLRILQTNGDLAQRQIPASVAMILLASARDVDGLSLWVLLGRFVLLSGNRERNSKEERYAERERRKQASHGEPPGGRITPLSLSRS